MAYLKSSNTLRKIAILTLVFVCWATKVPPKRNWINQEFNYTLRTYEFMWQVRLSDKEAKAWQLQFFTEYETYLRDWRAWESARLARGEAH